jgi:hypothetical protein
MECFPSAEVRRARLKRGLAPIVFLVAGLFAGGTAAQSHDEPLRPVRKIELDGRFAGKQPGKNAKDLSGLSCAESQGGGTLHCLAINDENQSAQLATIENGAITVGAEIKLIGNAPTATTFGTRPDVKCPSTGGFEEFDGEGVAYADGVFYVVGSHGCSRKSGEFRLSSFLMARIRFDPQDAAKRAASSTAPESGDASLETTYRLGDALRRGDTIGAHFGKDLSDANGLNIEGIAVLRGRLYAGLRAPSVAGKAFLVSVGVADLFAPGSGALSVTPEVIPVALGPNVGIRDLAPLPDGRLLILAGPAQEQEDVPYGLFAVEPREGRLARLGILAEIKGKGDAGKAEAVTILKADAKELRVVILFDGFEDGGPREYRVPMKQR